MTGVVTVAPSAGSESTSSAWARAPPATRTLRARPARAPTTPRRRTAPGQRRAAGRIGTGEQYSRVRSLAAHPNPCRSRRLARRDPWPPRSPLPPPPRNPAAAWRRRRRRSGRRRSPGRRRIPAGRLQHRRLGDPAPAPVGDGRVRRSPRSCSPPSWSPGVPGGRAPAGRVPAVGIGGQLAAGATAVLRRVRGGADVELRGRARTGASGSRTRRPIAPTCAPSADDDRRIPDRGCRSRSSWSGCCRWLRPA